MVEKKNSVRFKKPIVLHGQIKKNLQIKPNWRDLIHVKLLSTKLGRTAYNT